ncbi:MAG: hypothetical protein AAFQ68_16490 [Bacteroidota bacterium]
MLNKLRHRLASGKLPYGPRLALIAIALINLPGALLGVIGFWTIIPLPGLVIYFYVLRLAFGKAGPESAKIISTLAIAYQAIVLIVFLAITLKNPPIAPSNVDILSIFSTLGYLLSPIGLYALVLRMLKETTPAI